MTRVSIVVLASSLVASLARAHPGHGDPAHAMGFVHYATQPEHLLVGLAVAIAAVAAARVWSRRTAD